MKKMKQLNNKKKTKYKFPNDLIIMKKYLNNN